MQVYSARTALAGCKTLADMWSHQDTDELQRLKDQLTMLQDSGVVFPEDSWPTRLLRSHPRWARRRPRSHSCSDSDNKTAHTALSLFRNSRTQ